MKTYALFYELFTIDPQLLFRLLGIEMSAQYTFHSITVKQTEKRIDGYFVPVDGEGPLVFAEVQGYNDPRVYWRLLREMATCLEQREDEPALLAVVLFLDPSLAPARCQVRLEAPSRLLVCHIEECLKAIREGAGALSVLKPLVASGPEVLYAELPNWKADIESLNLPEHLQKRLLELLEYAILQRFPRLTREEIKDMLQLTPLEETDAVRQIIHRSEARGEARGELIGAILAYQSVLGIKTPTRRTLAKKSLEALRQLSNELEARVRASK